MKWHESFEVKSCTMTELRKDFSRILAEVEAGGIYVVTRYGKPVAALVPPSWVEGK